MRRALLAAVEVGAAHGIDASDPVLLHETNNTVVWLRPSPVVAKVATRADAKLDVRLEHAVATELRYGKCDTSIYSFNAASIRLHERLGFQVEGRIRRAIFARGEYHDEILVGITAEEFFALQPR